MDEEALELLKKFYQDGRLDKIRPEGTNLVLGDKTYPKKLKIERFGGKYDLHSIFHLVKHNYPEKRSTEYFQEGKEEGVIFLSAVHIPEVYEFLRSKRESENDSSIPGLNAVTLPQKRRGEEIISSQPLKKILSTSESLQPIELTEDIKKSKVFFIQMIEFKNKSIDEENKNDENNKNNKNNNEKNNQNEENGAKNGENEQNNDEKNEKNEKNGENETNDRNNNENKEKLFIESTKELTKMIQNREKVFQNRNTILQSSNKQFQSIIDTIRDHIQSEKLEERRKRDEKKKIDAGYDRYSSNNEAIWKDHHLDIQELKIDPMGSFSKQGLNIPPITKSILNNNNNNNNIGGIGGGNSSLGGGNFAANLNANSNFSSSSKDKKRRSSSQIPIIIVPSAVTSLLSLQNVKEFIENGLLTNEKLNIAKKPSSILVTRQDQKGNRSHFFVIDNPSKLKEPDWEKVVAVFALGAEWQFKDWRWNTPVDVFSRAKGFYLTYDDTPVPEKISSWDVTILKVNRHQSHTVKQAQLLFWDLLDKSLKKKYAKSAH